MIILWFKKRSAVKKSKEIIRRTEEILRKHGKFLPPETVDEANRKIGDSYSAIQSGGINEIDRTRRSLANFNGKNLKSYEKSKIRQNIEIILFALALAFLIRTFVVQPFKIPSGSMIPTLLIGDQLLVNKFVYGTKIPFTDNIVFPIKEIQNGDVVVFKFPEDRDSKVGRSGVHYIKRVIGTPGDEIDIKNRQIYINGKAVEQKYTGNYQYIDDSITKAADRYLQTFETGIESSVIYKRGSEAMNTGYTNFPVTVPEGSLFVMGDNRDNSYDSRFWGFVPIKNVSGKAFLIHWSWDFGNPDLFGKIRWSRIFTDIN